MVPRRLPIVLLAGCGLAALAGAVLADPPGRVGRVSDVEGQVSFLPPDDPDWVEALRNYPVTSGEGFWTGDEGRLELQLGGVQARLDSETELDVVDLDYGATRLSIPQGSVDVRLWRVPEGGVTVATPAGDVRLDQPGAYRIDVAAPDDSGDYPPVEVTALEGGQAEAPGPNGFVDVPAGAAAVAYAGYDPELQDALGAAIDDWSRQREAGYDQVNWQDESEPGYADLSGYGQFVQDPTYGQVWYPTDVPPDWAPYRFGQWSYVQPWGWTWIDDQPWGFAPFHYGRWALIDGRWGWTPGQRAARPVYAPALVAFVGGDGFAVSVGMQGGAFAWVPLAPDEPYTPPYQVSESYVRQVNITSVNITVINNMAHDNTTVIEPARLRNAAAVSAISTNSLTHGAKVQQAAVRVTPQALAQARVATTSAPPPPRPVGASGARGEGAVAGSGGLHAAPPPPAKVQQLRAAVAHAPPGSTAPPPIPGVHTAAARPPRGAAPSLIAPAATGGRQPPARPLAPRPAASPNGGQIPPGGPQGRPRPTSPGPAASPPETPQVRRPAGSAPRPAERPTAAPQTPAGEAAAAPKSRPPMRPAEGAPPPPPRQRPTQPPTPPPAQTRQAPAAEPKTGPGKPPPKTAPDKKKNPDQPGTRAEGQPD